MQNLIGYLINTPIRTWDSAHPLGSAFNYGFAGNGVWMQAENNHLWARIPVAECQIRGLYPIDTVIQFKHGRIPQRFWDLALSALLAHPEEERYVGIRWTGTAYDIYYPAQDGKAASVSYDCGENVVFEMHSHPGMGPFFSDTDDADEQGLKIYGVLGYTLKDYSHMNGGLPVTQWEPLINLRIGVYGYFHPVAWGEVFEGGLGDVIDVLVDKDEEPA
jgi:hypothetical protein